MKHKSLLILAGVALAAFLSGCLRDECTSTHTFTRFNAVFKTASEVRVGIKTEAPRELRNPGKLYVFGQYLFINEINEGIHVIDNSDAANPKQLVFWSIPGNVDMAIRGNFMYVDQYVDLVTVDISDLQNPQEVCRNQEAFLLYGVDPQRGYLVNYEQTEVTEKVSCEDSRWGTGVFFEGTDVFISNDLVSATTADGPKSNPLAAAGIGGSFARFSIVDQYLYTVDNATMRIWTGNSCPSLLETVNIGWNIETIFPWKNRLFIGSQTGVFIFNNSDPLHPVLETQFSHATGCDPVVCDDRNAYVTIHDGTTCNGTFNQLDVIGIENLPTATLDKSYPMTRPMGLSVTNDFLYLCDDGLKIFDKTDPLNLKQKSHVKGLKTYDVIALGAGRLLVIGEDGFYQYDAANPEDPKELSRIPVVR